MSWPISFQISEGPGDAASKRRRILEMTGQIFNKYQKSYELVHFFPKQWSSWWCYF